MPPERRVSPLQVQVAARNKDAIENTLNNYVYRLKKMNYCKETPELHETVKRDAVALATRYRQQKRLSNMTEDNSLMDDALFMINAHAQVAGTSTKHMKTKLSGLGDATKTMDDMVDTTDETTALVQEVEDTFAGGTVYDRFSEGAEEELSALFGPGAFK